MSVIEFCEAHFWPLWWILFLWVLNGGAIVRVTKVVKFKFKGVGRDGDDGANE